MFWGLSMKTICGAMRANMWLTSLLMLVAASVSVSARNVPGAPEALSTLDQVIEEEPQLPVEQAKLTYDEAGGIAYLQTIDAVIDAIEGLPQPQGAATVSFSISYQIGNPESATGMFSVGTGTEDLLTGELLRTGYADSVFGLFFQTVSGTYAKFFGPNAILLAQMDPGFGLNPFETFVPGEMYAASLNVVKPVPLPAAAGALALGFGAIVAVGRVRRKPPRDKR